jgi:hypothetical protein
VAFYRGVDRGLGADDDDVRLQPVTEGDRLVGEQAKQRGEPSRTMRCRLTSH